MIVIELGKTHKTDLADCVAELRYEAVAFVPFLCHEVQLLHRLPLALRY